LEVFAISSMGSGASKYAFNSISADEEDKFDQWAKTAAVNDTYQLGGGRSFVVVKRLGNKIELSRQYEGQHLLFVTHSLQPRPPPLQRQRPPVGLK
jgi:hypothetical protein